jgi:hypothetical protein
MPNQLAKSKRRQSLAEHEAVLAALALIARHEKTSVMALLREAARELVRRKSAQMEVAQLRDLVGSKAPRMPARFRSAAQVVRFKRAQREFDQVVLDLGLAQPTEVQQRNSLAPTAQPIRILELERTHAAAR